MLRLYATYIQARLEDLENGFSIYGVSTYTIAHSMDEAWGKFTKGAFKRFPSKDGYHNQKAQRPVEIIPDDIAEVYLAQNSGVVKKEKA